MVNYIICDEIIEDIMFLSGVCFMIFVQIHKLKGSYML